MFVYLYIYILLFLFILNIVILMAYIVHCGGALERNNLFRKIGQNLENITDFMILG